MNFQELYQNLEKGEETIAVVGLGYVGLPLACHLSKKFKLIGFDINKTRIEELSKGIDRTNEIEDSQLLKNANLKFTDQSQQLKNAKLIIVAVPTPIDIHTVPDLTPIKKASETIGKNISKGTTIVYESTVYPGLTEKYCREIIEKESGFEYKKDFFLGYSPERINPGDKEHTFDKIVKVVSGCTDEVAAFLEKVYGSVVKAGIHKAPNIATAEAAKVIENTQRDLNIALINELAKIFDRIDLDTREVLEAAKTKWNFLPFAPGLVGGHCIGVDPYYLTYLAQSVGMNPEVITAGRRTNDGMAHFIAERTIKMIIQNRKNGTTTNPITIGMLGVTFKENVPDLRNSKVIDLGNTLENFGAKVFYCDPVPDREEFHEEYHKELSDWNNIPTCDAVVLAVSHEIFKKEFPLNRIKEKLNSTSVLIDVKGMFDHKTAKNAGLNYWRL